MKTKLPKFIFTHVLKTSGTSFRVTILDRFYKNRYVNDKGYKVRDVKKKRALALSRKMIQNFNSGYPKGYKNKDVIFGHFRSKKYEHLNLPVVTFLRDPVERLVSQYFYQRGYLGDLTIEEFAEIYSNHMTFILGSDLEKIEFIGFQESFNDSINRFVKHFGLPSVQRFARERVSKKKKTILKKSRKYIKSINKEDYKLYNDALKYRREG